jgi:hypothetical protein
VTLTIVSVNKNNFIGLLNTLTSLCNISSNKNVNHLIVDGNSNDLLEDFNKLKYKFKFDYISENDSGIYNAMNKGITLSTGNRLLFLNSGDTINNYFHFNQFISQSQDIDIVYSNIAKLSKELDFYHENRFPENLSLDYMICFGLPHQATIINRSLFDKVGFYDEKYSIISDWVFFMEALFFHNATYKYVDITAINFDCYGISNQNHYLKKIISEQFDYILKRFPSKIDLYKANSPYVKKYFRIMPRWKKYIMKYLFFKFNLI